jgi:hypothetical protein
MAESSPDRQVYMASLRNVDDDESGPEYDEDYLRTYLPMNVRQTPLRMRTRSIEGPGG